jgi:hypothetical protein
LWHQLNAAQGVLIKSNRAKKGSVGTQLMDQDKPTSLPSSPLPSSPSLLVASVPALGEKTELAGSLFFEALSSDKINYEFELNAAQGVLIKSNRAKKGSVGTTSKLYRLNNVTRMEKDPYDPTVLYLYWLPSAVDGDDTIGRKGSRSSKSKLLPYKPETETSSDSTDSTKDSNTTENSSSSSTTSDNNNSRDSGDESRSTSGDESHSTSSGEVSVSRETSSPSFRNSPTIGRRRFSIARRKGSMTGSNNPLAPSEGVQEKLCFQSPEERERFYIHAYHAIKGDRPDGTLTEKITLFVGTWNMG